MSTYDSFIFDSYSFDRAEKTLRLQYSYDDQRQFTEVYRFDFDFIDYDEAALDRALQLVFFVAGVSYYKAYLPENIAVRSGQIDQLLADFLRRTYERGLGEFFYVNRLDPRTPVNFLVNQDKTLNTLSVGGEGVLVGLGGGKDSLVSVELLKNQPKVATWSMNHRQQLEPLVRTIGLPHFWVERTWDPQLLELKDDPEAMNGHVPISALFAAVGTVVAILTGYRDNVVSNESTASEPNLEHQGVAINHQYSKSFEFEQDFQSILAHAFGDSLRYYSLLRPFTELRIAELFSQLGFEKYKSVFSSCNRAYVHGASEMFWCGECPKCAFVFLALTPFIERSDLEKLFGKNLLLDPSLEPTYRQLLGIEGEKPLDCVGEIKESRAAMRLAQSQYPELDKYSFDLPEDYDFRARSAHRIPEDMVSLLPADEQPE